MIVFVFLAVVFFSRQFAPTAESAVREKKLRTNAAPDKRKIENYDIRTDRSEAARRLIDKYALDAGKSAAQVSDARALSLDDAERMRAAQPNLKIEFNDDLRIPEVVSPDYAAQALFLTAASVARRTDILRNFLKQNAALFGVGNAQIDALETSADYINPSGRLSFVNLEQKIGGVPVFRGEVKAALTEQGEIARVINNLAPALDADAVRADFGDAGQAVLTAAEHIGAALTGTSPVSVTESFAVPQAIQPPARADFDADGRSDTCRKTESKRRKNRRTFSAPACFLLDKLFENRTLLNCF